VADRSPPRRPYDSPQRREQAAATRRAILEAAQRRFERDGYVATNVEAIADEAGVVRKTVYLAFANKAGVLRGVWDMVLKGDTDEAPVAARPWYVEMLLEPDPVRLLRLVATNSVAVKRRIGPMLAVIRDAAVIDDDAGALWRLIQTDFHENQRRVVEALYETGGLRLDRDVEQATDVLWTLNHPDVWLLLVGERGWTAEAFQEWFAETLGALLLAPGYQSASTGSQAAPSSSASDAGATDGRAARPSSSSSGRRSTKPASIPPRSS
jgi:AcrR family transcriptional regulator